ncbi:MAG: amidohydrolase family protein [Synergistaceae bacterium]|jgi:adenine deaminase|nr:amidohydrolase family protein [Synergistaceae bacterium]
MRELLAAARGDMPCDLLIQGGTVANVLSLEYEKADVAVKDGIIVGVGGGYTGLSVADASGKVLIPGMIDAHLHIESTMLRPSAFAAAVLPVGTTTIFPDPHEIANTCGLDGIEFMWRDSLRTPLDIFFGAPSCVPASMYETPYREIDALGIVECYSRNWCSHLGEMMNYPSVLSGDERAWSKIFSSWDRVKTAHLPGVSGKELCAYLLSRCDGDHESSFAEEALEKLRRGVWVMFREGAAEHNLLETAKIILDDEARYARCMAVSDDLTASALLADGHMDHKVRLLVKAGIRPIIALAMVTINPANYFRMWDRGAVAPGRIADIVMVDSIEECRALRVWKRGRLAAEHGHALFHAAPASAPPETPKLKTPLSEEMFKIPARGGEIRVIEALPGLVVTRALTLPPKVRDGYLVSDTERDVIKMAVVEKNRGTGLASVGFVKGFGLKRGALASSVAHDAHNYVVIGADDRSMLTALRRVAENGGLAVADGDRVISNLSLPIGGLMSDLDAPELSAAYTEISHTAETLETAMPQPFMAMSFLSLSVIPELKLTDQGYVDPARGVRLDLFVRSFTGGD